MNTKIVSRLIWLSLFLALLGACTQRETLVPIVVATPTMPRATDVPRFELPPTWTPAPTHPPTLTATLRPTRTPAPTETAIPTLSPSPTRPTPTLSPDLLASLSIVYTWEDRLIVWQNGITTTVAITTSDTITASITRPDISDDGTLIAFQQGDSLWVAARDGSGVRQLVGGQDFAQMEPLDPGVRLYRFGWIPGTHDLLFNTVKRMEYGLDLTDDLHRANADTGEWETLAPPGLGGACYPSPDGLRIACVTPSEIAVMTADGRNRQTLLSYEPVFTYSEFEYYAQPLWAADSQSLVVAIPPVDPLGDPAAPTTIWRLPLDGAPPATLSQVVHQPFEGRVVISPDGSRLAYGRYDSTGSRLELHLATIDLSEDTIYAVGQVGFTGWAPDSQHFTFWRDRQYKLFVGEWDDPDSDAVTDAAGIYWLDAHQFLYFTGTASHPQLWLGTAGEPGVLLVNGFVEFDFLMSLTMR